MKITPSTMMQTVAVARVTGTRKVWSKGFNAQLARQRVLGRKTYALKQAASSGSGGEGQQLSHADILKKRKIARQRIMGRKIYSLKQHIIKGVRVLPEAASTGNISQASILKKPRIPKAGLLPTHAKDVSGLCQKMKEVVITEQEDPLALFPPAVILNCPKAEVSISPYVKPHLSLLDVLKTNVNCCTCAKPIVPTINPAEIVQLSDLSPAQIHGTIYAVNFLTEKLNGGVVTAQDVKHVAAMLHSVVLRPTFWDQYSMPAPQV